MKRIKKELKSKMVILSDAYKSASGGEWLADNFYIIEKNYASAIKDISRISLYESTDAIIDLCKKICKDGILPCDSEIISILLNKSISTAALENLAVFLKTVLITKAADSVSKDEEAFSQCIRSLIRLEEADFGKILYEASVTEKILCQDPAGIYRNMDEHTKAMYRRAVYREAAKQGKGEDEIAVKSLDAAVKENRHIGFYLTFDKKNHSIGKYILIAEAVLPFAVLMTLSFVLKAWYLLPLLYFPLWEVLKFISDFIISKISRPLPLPSMDYSRMIPQSEKTVIALSTLLPEASKAGNMTAHLRKLCLSNCKENVYICILADLSEAKTPSTSSDEASINAMKRVTDELNKKYGNKIVLATRSRRFSITENCYCAHERKRGAITSLVKLIKGDTNEFSVLHGNAENLKGAKYIMALDSDTNMPAKSLNALVGIASHPLNRPVISPSKQRVTQGYGIISPRMETGLQAHGKTHFSFLFSGSDGLSAYSHTVGERYQDLFGKSIFSGKGLIDVDSYYRLIPDRLPEEQILSHDILEGIALRNAFAGNIALTDSFPLNENSYFKRMHRWIRGDVQNIQLLFDLRYKAFADTLGKWWLIDNIRRAITPVFAAIGILLSAFMPGNTATTAVLICLLSVSSAHLSGFVQSVIHGGFSVLSRLYFSSTVPYAVSCLTKAFLEAVSLVRYSVCSADAIIRSVYRISISRRHLLEWTTAADSESGNSTKQFVKKSLPSVTTGIVLLIFGAAAAKFAGILFICDLPFAILSAKSKKSEKPRLFENERKELTSYLASMWQFYEDFCTQEHNYLIPDNVQYSPVYAVADRTSPTNIGLMLCSFLGARILNFIDSERLCALLERSLDTIEKLPKYKGNLYNWYNTKTLEILPPYFISTVDSGNFLCCLTSLRNGLKNYIQECDRLAFIIKRLDSIINACELDFLYSEKRNLFHIGYDTQTQSLTPSYFDLLMSEARMTSYFAVASEKVSFRHWEALGRTIKQCGRYTGPVSWSGTMFEYFMPAIFLPDYPNTIGSEALNYCIYCQKKNVRGKNIPYGISESCYYAFDSNLNYSYKAHGVKALSLRNDRSNETVISPYSTFLTLSQDPHSAMRNLKKTEKLGATGRYGFIEAIDFTHSRRAGSELQLVNCFMSHHIGMSFLAAVNCMHNNIFTENFITDDMMYGCIDLMYEKIPADAKIYKSIQWNDKQSRPERYRNVKITKENITASNPDSTVFSNGRWTLFACDTGCNASAYNGISVFKCRKDPYCYPDGIFAAIKYNGDKVLTFSDAPYYEGNTKHCVQKTDTSLIYKNYDDAFACTQTVAVHPTTACQMHNFRIRNKAKAKKDALLMIYAEPSLVKATEAVAHPAFSNMFIEVQYNADEKVLIFTRKAECKENQLYIALGFASKSDFEFSTDRESVLSSNTGIFRVFDNSFDNSSASVDKCIALQLKINLAPYGTFSDTLLITAASDREDAISSIIGLRSSRLPSVSRCTPSLFAESSIEGIYAKKICERFLFGRALPADAIRAGKINNGSRKDLWATGISGDYPIIIVKCESNDTTVVLPFVTLHSKLKGASLQTELVFITDSSDGYTSAVREAVISVLNDTSVINRHGGIFILSLNSVDRTALCALTASAIAVYPETENEADDNRFILSPISQCSHRTGKNMFAKNGYIIGEPTYLPWSHIISNRNFGTLITNGSLGYTWALNSRENKLSPWYNDTRRAYNGEMLYLSSENGRFDLIKGSCAFFKDNKGEYYAFADGLNFRTTVTVSGEAMCKTIDICIINDSQESRDFAVNYYWEPCLGDIADKKLFIKKEVGTDRIIIRNLYNDIFDGCTVLSCDRECSFSFSKAAFLSGCHSENDTFDCIIAERRLKLKPSSSVNIKFCLSYGKSVFSSIKMPYIRQKSVNKNRITIETPDKNLNDFFNSFLLHQVVNGRIFARTGFYQCSGAYGFRDQLQDAMSVAITHPEILKMQILYCCAAQFTQGDVLHWFHQLYFNGRRVLRGVRTLYSDDLLWLPLAVSEYCRVSGDLSILETKIPFLEAPVLEKGETERFGEFTKSQHTGTVYSHCISAITHACKFGRHSLPLIKGGDWNDSFNQVGILGKGESVWLGMFLSYTLKNFASLCDIKRDKKTAEAMRLLSKKLLEATDAHAWDKDRYLRCFYDDGTSMGKEGNNECAIDLLPQAWSVISGMPDKKRCRIAADTAYTQLVDKENGIIKLFTPAFNEKSKKTGYVNRYPEGVRENAGQYTHGALWLAQAYFMLNEPSTGYELIKILNPANKPYEKYKAEPYYLAGDVYSAQGMQGRGGWSIYTGSAGWFYRIVVENMFGIIKRKYDIKANPRLPDELRESRVKIELNGSTREFRL